MTSKYFLHKNQIIWVLLLFFLVVCCLGPYFYLTVAREWDYQECIPKAAKNIGVEPKISAIYKWINDNETPGLSREASRSILENLGTTTFVGSRSIANGPSEDTLRVNICSHPMNNIVLFANYSTDNKLIGITIDNN